MWRNVARLSGGTAIGQGLVVLSTPLLTRLYTPDAFGQFGLYLSFAAVAMVFIGLRYDLAIASADDDREADELLLVALLACVPTSLIAASCLWAMIKWEVLGYAALPARSVPVVALLLAATGAVVALRYWNVRAFRFQVVAVASALQGLGRAVVPLMAALASPGWWGLLAGDAAGRLFGATRLLHGAAARLKGTRLSALGAATRRHWRYPGVVLPSALLDALVSALPLPLVSALFGVGAAGQFALVQRMAAVPSSLVAASFADVIHAEGVRLRDTEPMALASFAAGSARRLGLVGGLVYVPVMVLAPVAFPLVFGESYRQAGVLAAVLTPLLWLSLVVSPLSRLLLVTGRTGLKFLVDTVRLALPAAVLVAAKDVGFLWSMTAFGVASVCANLLYLGAIWFAVRQTLDRSRPR